MPLWPERGGPSLFLGRSVFASDEALCATHTLPRHPAPPGLSDADVAPAIAEYMDEVGRCLDHELAPYPQPRLADYDVAEIRCERSAQAALREALPLPPANVVCRALRTVPAPLVQLQAAPQRNAAPRHSPWTCQAGMHPAAVDGFQRALNRCVVANITEAAADGAHSAADEARWERACTAQIRKRFVMASSSRAASILPPAVSILLPQFRHPGLRLFMSQGTGDALHPHAISGDEAARVVRHLLPQGQVEYFTWPGRHSMPRENACEWMNRMMRAWAT